MRAHSLCLQVAQLNAHCTLVTGNKTVMHWGEFLCATITSIVVGMPFVMLNCGAIELNAALLGLSGFILATTTLMCAVCPPFL